MDDKEYRTGAVVDFQALNNMDPLHKLQRMSLSELTNAYDFLLSVLK